MQHAFRVVFTGYLCAITTYMHPAEDREQSIKQKILTRFLSYGSVLNCDPQPSKIIQELGEESMHRISTDNPMASPLAEDSFNAICALSSPTLEPKEKHTVMLKTFYNILRPDGLLILALRKGDEASKGYSEEEVKKILANAGFEILDSSIVEGPEYEQQEQFIEILSKKTTLPHQ